MTDSIPLIDALAFRSMIEHERDLIGTFREGTTDHYLCLQDFVLREGELFERIVDPYPEERYPRGEPRACFRNATTLALENRELTYVEGYAYALLFPMLHAWCVTADDEVIDPTWDEHNPGQHYLGVRFDVQQVLRNSIENDRYGMLDVWEKRYPILHEPHVPYVRNEPFVHAPNSR